MAAQPQLRYCGRCGAPLPSGATFCGRCGTPAATAAVAQPVYRYAPPPAYPTARQYKLAPAMIAGGLVLILIVVAVIVGAFAASQFAGGGHAPCTVNCSPKFVTPLAEEATFRSSTYKFQGNYSSAWTVRGQDATGVTFGTRVGSVQVTGSSGGSPDRALQSAVSGLPSSKWQDVTLVGNLRGAHIGDQDGAGAGYSANLIGSSQTEPKVRFAATTPYTGRVRCVVFGAVPLDP